MRDLKKKTNRHYLYSLTVIGIIVLLLPFVSCGRPKPDSHRSDAVDLYNKSVKLIKLYLDSFSMASDSATLLEMNGRFEHDLTALNFKYPSETCLEISEGENDTLTNLTCRLIEIRDSLLYRYAHPVLNTDSLSSDSVIADSLTPSDITSH